MSIKYKSYIAVLINFSQIMAKSSSIISKVNLYTFHINPPSLY